MPYQLKRFASTDPLAREVARLWREKIKALAPLGRPILLAISGGRIAPRLFQAFSETIAGDTLPEIHFFWADERCLPPDDPESNFAPAQKSLFEPLRIRPGLIHRIQGELGPDRAAALAEADFNATAPRAHPADPVFDLVLLGMGEDGHIASLFPNGLDPSAGGVYRGVQNSPKPPPQRVSLTYGALAAAREAWVIVSGDGKQEALRRVLEGDPTRPLAKLLALRSDTKLFADSF